MLNCRSRQRHTKFPLYSTMSSHHHRHEMALNRQLLVNLENDAVVCKPERKTIVPSREIFMNSRLSATTTAESRVCKFKTKTVVYTS